jgi:GNAT superfamily N-acetyltransferase
MNVSGVSFDYGDVGVALAGEFHASSLCDPFYRYMHRWRASLIAHPDLDEGSLILGRADVLQLRVYDIVDSGVDPWEVLDAEEGDLEMVGRVLLDSDGFREELGEEHEGWAPDLLILNHVQLEPEARGFGLGPLFAALVLEPLLAGARMVACYPAPIGGDQDDLARAAAVAKLGGTWAKAGFQPLRDGVWIIDTAATHYVECWQSLHRSFGLLRS